MLKDCEPCLIVLGLPLFVRREMVIQPIGPLVVGPPLAVLVLLFELVKETVEKPPIAFECGDHPLLAPGDSFPLIFPPPPWTGRVITIPLPLPIFSPRHPLRDSPLLEDVDLLVGARKITRRPVIG